MCITHIFYLCEFPTRVITMSMTINLDLPKVGHRRAHIINFFIAQPVGRVYCHLYRAIIALPILLNPLGPPHNCNYARMRKTNRLI